MKSIILVMAAAALVSTPVWANDTTTVEAPVKQGAIKHQTVCPVMGGKINKKQFIDVEGKRIYVCCMGCLAPIKKNPATYIKQMEAKGITLELAPKPVTSKPAKR